MSQTTETYMKYIKLKQIVAHKTKTFFAQKRKQHNEKQLLKWEEIFAKCLSFKELMSNIYNDSQLIAKPNINTN